MNAAGLVYGTPTLGGTFNFTVTVTDGSGSKASLYYTLVINGAVATTPVSISTVTLPNGTVGTAYSATVTAVNGKTPYTFASSGSVPAGLSLSTGGVLAGTPTTAGSYSFTVGVTDAIGGKASATYNVTIAGVTSPTSLQISTTSLPSAVVGTAYSAMLSAVNGTSPYSFSSGVTLPNGLSLSTAGALTGTPSTQGSYPIPFTVTDAKGQQASATLTLLILQAAQAVTITTASLPSGTANVAYSTTIAAANGTTPYSFTVSGTLPNGLSLSTLGVLSGTPTASGSYSPIITVTDAANGKASTTFNLVIAPAVSGSSLSVSTTVAGALINTSYSSVLAITGGTGPYKVTQAGGTLPNGITLASNGTLSGTPTATGSYSFSVSATDSSTPLQTATATISLSVATATVTVNTATTLATVPANFFGLHTSVYDGSLGDASGVAPVLKAAGITTLRYPGGSYADRYHWAQYSETPLYTSTAPACGIVQGELQLEPTSDFGHFIKTVQASGATPLITVNYGTSLGDANGTKKAGTMGLTNNCSEPNQPGQPQEAAAWVAYANGDPANTQVIGIDAVGFNWKTVGFWAGLRAANPLANDDGYNFLRIGNTAPIGIKHWELGNEMYYNGWAGNRNFEGDLHAPYIYPNGYSPGAYESRDQLAALSPAAYGANSAAFIAAMKAVDSTIQIGLDFSSPIYDDPIPGNWNTDVPQAACGLGNFDLAIIHYYPGTYLAVQPGELLSLPQVEIPNVVAGIKKSLAQYCPSNAANMRFVLSETSPNATLAPGFPNEVLGLFVINEYLTALQQGILNVDYLELHDMAGTFLSFDEKTPGPVFYGLQMAHQLAGTGDSVVSAVSSSSTVVSYAAAKSNGQKALILINADASNAAVVQVSFPGATLGATATQYSYGVGTKPSGTALTGTSFAVPGSTFNVTIPAYQAVELILQ